MRGFMAESSDAIEKRVRFGCGAFLGFFIGAISLFTLSAWDISLALSLLVATTVLSGYFAMKHGDHFWRNADKYFWWWP
jgi:hypothetical protein